MTQFVTLRSLLCAPLRAGSVTQAIENGKPSGHANRCAPDRGKVRHASSRKLPKTNYCSHLRLAARVCWRCLRSICPQATVPPPRELKAVDVQVLLVGHALALPDTAAPRLQLRAANQ